MIAGSFAIFSLLSLYDKCLEINILISRTSSIISRFSYTNNVYAFSKTPKSTVKKKATLGYHDDILKK